MTKAGYKARIKKACKEVDTYKPAFDNVIDALADILARRDEVKRAYDQEGEGPVVIHVNQGGNENTTKNPLLVLWMDLNSQALAYWKELGLTPSGLKRINDEQMKGKRSASFADILDELSK